MNKSIIAIVLVLVVILAIVLVHAGDDSSVDDGNRTILNVSSEGPYKLSEITQEIRTHEYYKGYDNETLEWMESLGNKYVWNSHDAFVIMDKGDADKIPTQFVCDASFYEIFSCNVIEEHSLGYGDNLKDVLYVKNVKYIGEEVIYYEV